MSNEKQFRKEIRDGSEQPHLYELLEMLEDTEDTSKLLRAAEASILEAATEHGWKILTGYEVPEAGSCSNFGGPDAANLGHYSDKSSERYEQVKAELSLERSEIFSLKIIGSRYARLSPQCAIRLLEACYKPYLKRNRMTLETVVRLPGQPAKTYLKGADLVAEWEEAFDYMFSNLQHFDRQWRRISRDADFHPFEEYLDSLQDMTLEESQAVKASAVADIFGKSPEDDDYSLDTELFWHWLLSIVARTYQPGCPNRGALVLVSKQGGTGKNTFFQAMALGKAVTGVKDAPFYASFDATANDYVQTEARARGVIREIEEIEVFTSKRGMAELRQLLTAKEIEVNRKYQQPETVLDGGVWGISSNNGAIFNDDNTTRYYTIRVRDEQHSIDNRWVEANVDRLYRAARAEYKAKVAEGLTGFWELSKTLGQLNEARNANHMIISAYVDKAGEVLEALQDVGDIEGRKAAREGQEAASPAFKITDFYAACGVSLKDRIAQNDIKRFLEKEGFKEGTIRAGTKPMKAWHKPGLKHQLMNQTAISQATNR